MLSIPFKITTTSFNTAKAEITIQYLPDDLIEDDSVKAIIQGQIIGPLWFDRETVFVNHALEAVPTADDTVRATISSPLFWSPETPYLYLCEIEVARPGETTSKFSFSWGIKSLQISRSSFTLNREKHLVRGVRLTQALTPQLASQLRQVSVNTLIVPLESLPSMENLPSLADTLGFHVLYEVPPDDESLLWHAESQLFAHISTFGWILPQASMQNAQLWHNAMLHLHRQRRDVFVGILIDSVPLSMVQGHVEFILVPMNYVEELAGVTMPRLALARRFDLLAEKLPTNLAGYVSRQLPQV